MKQVFSLLQSLPVSRKTLWTVSIGGVLLVLVGGVVFVYIVWVLFSSLLAWGESQSGIWDRVWSRVQVPVQGNGESVRIIDEQSQVIEVVQKASPAVVSIVASAEVPTFETYYYNPFPESFGFGFGIPQQRQNGTKQIRVGAGTGFFVSADGYIVTNRHVVDDEDAEYTVYLNDEVHRGEKVRAQVLARDPNKDLAILKVDKTDLPYLEFGDSDTLQVGQTSITIGYALGEFDNTVSKGVVSGLSRTITAGSRFGGRSEELRNLIQSDAAINPGNSGGPMLDIFGKVIGVNVAMATAENIGFAIPANEVRAIFEEVKQTGTIEKKEQAFLGVRYMLVNEQIAADNQLPYDYGAIVTRGDTRAELAVMPGSPADKAGIMENDILLEINGQRITERNTVADSIRGVDPGTEITILLFRKGEERDVVVRVEGRR